MFQPKGLGSMARRLQGSSVSYDCQSWIFGSELGAAWFGCFFSLAFNAPQANVSNNCIVDWAPFCTSDCYQSLTDGFDYMVKTGICSDFTDSSDTDGCNDDPSFCFSTEACVNDNCMELCNVTADCLSPDPCDAEENKYMMCTQPTGATQNVCVQNETEGTITNMNLDTALAAVGYSFHMMCAQNNHGDYCLSVLEENTLKNDTTCADYGCCLGTVLLASQYCFGGVVPSDVNNPLFPNLTTCQEAKQTCPPLPLAKSYCSNGVENLNFSVLAVLALIFTSLWAM